MHGDSRRIADVLGVLGHVSGQSVERSQLINQFANPSDPKTLKKAREIVVSRIDMIIDGPVDRKKLKKA